MPHDVPTLRGPTHPYQKRLFDWRAVFADLARGSPPPTIRSVAKDWALPEATVRRRWRKYQRAIAEDDSTLLAIACGDVDGRRDNHRVFSRDEEALLHSTIEQENVDPNKPVIQRLAIAIHEQHKLALAPASSTRSQRHHEPSFNASDGFVERIKRDLHLSSQRVKIMRRNKREKGPEVDEALQVAAIKYVDDVHRSVLRNGARFVINADEISAKIITPPLTLLAPVRGSHPPEVRSNHTEKEAFTMILATTPSGVKLKPAVSSQRGVHVRCAPSLISPRTCIS
jgi:hypothetical protein